MMEILVVLFVVVVTAVLFCGWLIAAVVRFIWRGLAGPRQIRNSGAGRPCMVTGCRAVNPMHARYCRRCGSVLRAPVFAQQNPQWSPNYDPAHGRGHQVVRT